MRQATLVSWIDHTTEYVMTDNRKLARNIRQDAEAIGATVATEKHGEVITLTITYSKRHNCPPIRPEERTGFGSECF